MKVRRAMCEVIDAGSIVSTAAHAMQEETDRSRGPHRIGYELVPVALDDHSRFSYVEILDDQTTTTGVCFIKRAQEHYAERGVRLDRVLTDNGSGYQLTCPGTP